MIVGDMVRPKKGSFFEEDKWTGKVIDIQKWEELPLSDENHGSIAIEIITSDGYYLEAGEIESYTYFGWEDHLEIIS